MSASSAFAGAHVGVFVFSAEPGPDGATVYSRMFAPEAGVVEDPATGGASGPLGGYLVRHGVVPLAGAGTIVSAQGVKMGRPSRLLAQMEDGRARVGGDVVLLVTGTLRLPAGAPPVR